MTETDYQLLNINLVNRITRYNCTLVHLHLFVTQNIVTEKGKMNEEMSHRIDSNCQRTPKVKRVRDFSAIRDKHSHYWKSQSYITVLQINLWWFLIKMRSVVQSTRVISDH